MKRISTIMLFLLCGMAYYLKKTNGTFYPEHSAIATVESYLANHFKVYN